MTCEYEWMGFCGHDHTGTCEGCGSRTSEADGWCRRCLSLAPLVAYRAWLQLLDADQAAWRGPALVATP